MTDSESLLPLSDILHFCGLSTLRNGPRPARQIQGGFARRKGGGVMRSIKPKEIASHPRFVRAEAAESRKFSERGRFETRCQAYSSSSSALASFKSSVSKPSVNQP
jgi:hypothetical protein